MAAKLTEFTVRGHGPFPVDMLRYDSCHPVYPADATALIQTESRTVTLSTYAAHAPTRGRWESFGWTVLSSRVVR